MRRYGTRNRGRDKKMRLTNKVKILSNGKCEIDVDLENRRELNKIKETYSKMGLDKDKDYIFVGGFQVDITRNNNGLGEVSKLTITNFYPALAGFDCRTVSARTNVIVSIGDEKINLDEIIGLDQMLGVGYEKEYITEYNNAVARLAMTRLNYSNRDAIKLEIDIDYKKINKEAEERLNQILKDAFGL